MKEQRFYQHITFTGCQNFTSPSQRLERPPLPRAEFSEPWQGDRSQSSKNRHVPLPQLLPSTEFLQDWPPIIIAREELSFNLTNRPLLWQLSLRKVLLNSLRNTRRALNIDSMSISIPLQQNRVFKTRRDVPRRDQGRDGIISSIDDKHGILSLDTEISLVDFPRRDSPACTVREHEICYVAGDATDAVTLADGGEDVGELLGASEGITAFDAAHGVDADASFAWGISEKVCGEDGQGGNVIRDEGVVEHPQGWPDFWLIEEGVGKAADNAVVDKKAGNSWYLDGDRIVFQCIEVCVDLLFQLRSC